MHDLDKLNRERRGAETAKLEAARAMLTALERLMHDTPMLAQDSEAYRSCEASQASVRQALNAIIFAKAAGIKAEG